MQRKLAAILAADVVGYSRLMAADEAGTLSALHQHRQDTFNPAIARHGGRIVKLMGDGTLVEFASVVDAVECALSIQNALADGCGPIKLRIGINLGDVIIDGDDIYGDGVNIAARLEGLSDPGGISISSIVHESLGHRVDAQFSDAGAHEVKNIDRPIRVFKWPANDANEVQGRSTSASTKTDRPSIAVLPFDNLSGDLEQEYFSDGMCEDIITELSRFKEFFVIARNTSFSYKGKSFKISEVCKELGVRYVLEGSVRKAGNRIRVTGQLIDGNSDNHVWADRFDGTVDDIFDFQDLITTSIVKAVAPELLKAEITRSYGKDARDLDAWDQVMRARWHVGHFTADHVDEAKTLLNGAIAANPRLVQSYVELALCHVMASLYGWADDPRQEVGRATEAARQAVQLDPTNYGAQSMHGFSCIFARKYEDGLSHLRQGVQLNPNSATAYGFLSMGEAMACNYEACNDTLTKALQLSPHDPLRAFWYAGKGIAAFAAKKYGEVIEITNESIRANPDMPSAHRQQSAAYAMLDDMDKAQAAMGNLLRLLPNSTITEVSNAIRMSCDEAHNRWLDALRKAGLPE